MAATSPSMRWLYIAVLGPLVVLAATAWWGTQSQLKAAWTEAREEAHQIAPALAEEISSSLKNKITTIPLYPDPPPPGERSETDDLLDSDNLEVLRKIAYDSDAGLSPAGLPRQVLAALRVEELAPGTQNPYDFAHLLTIEAPSSLTRAAIARFSITPEAVDEWNEAEKIRAVASSLNPDQKVWRFIQPAPDEGRTRCHASFVQNGENQIDYVSSSLVDSTLLNSNVPARFWLELSPRAEGMTNSGLTMSRVPLPGHGEDVLLSINIGRAMVEGPIRRQQKWVLYLLAASLTTAAISLVIIHRTVARERRLADLKSQFVSSVSHELRAPLGSIRLMAEALQQEKVSKPGEFHTLIAREGARLSHLIENVLDFARIEEGRKHYRFEECDLTALLRDTLRLMQPIARDRGVHLTFELPEITSRLDPAAIQQALVNLLDNAIKFTPPQKAVNLKITRSAENNLEISISDQGPGIPRSEQRNIFKRFHRLGNELRRETQGTGIGLSIVKHIAEAHNGRVTVVSTPPDGSTFTLMLPENPSVA